MKSNLGLNLVFILLFAFTTMQAQEIFGKKIVEGKVLSASNEDVSGVHVFNQSTIKATITAQDGFFTIAAVKGDTLIFTAVQLKRKEIVVSEAMLNASIIYVNVEPSLEELDEVVVRPYNLSGYLGNDIDELKTGPVVTASTLGLPGANVKRMMQSERLLAEAAMPKFNVAMLVSLPVNPLINAITGRTKMLKERVARDKKYNLTQRITAMFEDPMYQKQLKLQPEQMDDFMYFCEVDTRFDSVAKTNDQLKIWRFLKLKSVEYNASNTEE